MPRVKNKRNASEPVVRAIDDDVVDSIFIDTAQDRIKYVLLQLDSDGGIVKQFNRSEREIVEDDFANSGQWTKYTLAIKNLQESLIDLEKHEGAIGAGTIESAANLANVTGGKPRNNK